MCTVTFIPTADKIYLTSNRDEKSWRKQALPPRFYLHNDVQLVYPRDEDAGGSWIAVNNNGNAAVLLNGAFIKHTPKLQYNKSRGLVLLNVVKSNAALKYFLSTDLCEIEPFTIILFEENNLYECRWDGNKKYYKQLKTCKAYIWSSVTLYDDAIVQKREEWFAEFLDNNIQPTQDDILHFHRFAGDGNTGTDLLMDRDGIVHTVSITSVEINNGGAEMHYLDLKNKEMYFAKTEFVHHPLQYEYHA